MDGDGSSPPHKLSEKSKNSSEPEVITPQVAHQSLSTNRLILLAYWIVILACLPIWWSLTSIERLSLPDSRILAQETAIQKFVAEINILLRIEDQPQVLKEFAPKLEKQVAQCAVVYPAAWRGINVKIIEDISQAHSPEVYDVSVHLTDVYRAHEVKGRHLDFYTEHLEGSELGQLLCDLLVPNADQPADQRIAQYSPTFRLAFSLLNEDIMTSGQRGWAIEKNIAAMITPTLEQLNALHNFTVESQVQFYAPLAFEPPKRNGEKGEYYALGEDERKIFINSAEWTLSSRITNDPVLHFILFVPAANHRPLLINNDELNQPLPTPAFIIPQWGGVVVFNPGHDLAPRSLAQIFSLFRSQLLSLLGVPALPSNVEMKQITGQGPKPLSDWQVDALIRRRSRGNADESVQALNSIVKLVNKLENMPVGMDVKGDVLRALEELEMMEGEASKETTVDLFTRSRNALKYSSQAFFNPGMVGQLYFPAEHKYAIYMLFVPASMPLVVTLIKEIKSWIKARKLARNRDD